MTLRGSWAGGFLLVAAIAIWSTVLAGNVQAAVAPLDDPVDTAVDAGLELVPLAARWWQWAMALPIEPVHDPDGRMCLLGRQTDVWFLAGTDGSRDDIFRECEVPARLPLLVPLAIRYAARPMTRSGASVDCSHLLQQVAMPPEGLQEVRVELDGVVLEAGRTQRAQGHCFDPYPALPHVKDRPAPLAASDGYWLLLDPLPAGEHVLEVHAHYRHPEKPAVETVQHYRYRLHVSWGQHFVRSRERPERHVGASPAG